VRTPDAAVHNGLSTRPEVGASTMFAWEVLIAFPGSLFELATDQKLVCHSRNICHQTSVLSPERD
jgi:hypothetical protein